LSPFCDTAEIVYDRRRVDGQNTPVFLQVLVVLFQSVIHATWVKLSDIWFGENLLHFG